MIKKLVLQLFYRTIRLFEENNIIEKHEFGDGRFRYEEVTETHHDHLIDIKSGKVIEFQNNEIEELQKKLLINSDTNLSTIALNYMPYLQKKKEK